MDHNDNNKVIPMKVPLLGQPKVVQPEPPKGRNFKFTMLPDENGVVDTQTSSGVGLQASPQFVVVGQADGTITGIVPLSALAHVFEVVAQ